LERFESVAKFAEAIGRSRGVKNEEAMLVTGTEAPEEAS
jgi:hypothetical protein